MFLLAALATPGAWAAAPARPAPFPARPAAPPPDAAHLTARVFAEVNAARAAAGTAALERPAALDRAAQRRAEDVAALPYEERMNRKERLGAFLARVGGVGRYAEARERLMMLSGFDDPAQQLLHDWRDYKDAWATAMSPAMRTAGFGWAKAHDGLWIFLAIFVEPQHDASRDELRTMEQQGFDAVNRRRVQHGLPALRWNTRLADVARAHSADMAARDYFDHADPEGRHPSDRVVMAGLPFSYVAENIARNHNMPDPVATAVNGWMESPGHRANILGPPYVESGLGVVEAADGTYYFTQLFYTAPATPQSPQAPAQ